ncbi:MAG: M48 family metalloprotease [Woeseiaceae bacterium]|nr:M48 family metalloprotease [Woeseiaceae bacterium]
MRTKIVTFAIAALFATTTAFGAKTKPVYEIQTLPEKQDESDLWESASRHEMRIRNSGTVFHDREVEAYLEGLAERLLGSSLDHLGIQLDFVLVAEPTLSGWVYPYGTIGIHTGLMVRMDNEAQLAAIVAHEISHFLQRHTYREMLDGDKQSALGKGLGFLATVAIARETGTVDTGIMDFTGELWTNLATSGYSKKNEYVADEEGLALMARAGLSIDEAIPAFQALAENEIYGAGDPRKMWSSHPRLESRIKNLQKEIKRAKRKKGYQQGITPETIDYDRKIAPILLINAKLDINEQKYSRARESLTRYLEAVPDDPEAHFLLGEAHRRQNPLGPDFSVPSAAYAQALVHDSGFAKAYRELGMAHRLSGRNEEAHKHFEKYLEIAGDAPDAGIIRWYMEGLR